jgi:hypothetical protein
MLLLLDLNGTGKTTAVRSIVDRVGEGVIYFDIPANAGIFPKALGKTLGFEYDELVSGYQALRSALLR